MGIGDNNAYHIKERALMADNKNEVLKLRVLIIGAGKGGSSLLPILAKNRQIEIVGVVDKNPAAPGLTLARRYNLPISRDYKKFLTDQVDLIINVTGSKELQKKLEKEKPKKTEIMSGGSALLTWILLEHSEKTAAMLKKIYDIALILSSSTELQKILKEIVLSAMEISNTPAGSIALYNPQKNQMEMAVSQGFSKNFSAVKRWQVRPNGLTNLILTRPYPTIIENVEKEPFFKNPILIQEGVKSLIATPLMGGGTMVGILYVDDFKPRQFESEEILALSLLANKAAISIEKAQLLEEIKQLSITDHLTQLYNHRYFRERLKEEFERSRRYNMPLSVVLADLDDFKQYNDEFGHLTGDHVLKKVARIIKANVRKADVVARYGGEEFILVLPQTNLEAALRVAERVRQAVERHVFKKGQKVLGSLTLSAGIACYPYHAGTQDELIGAADEALYEAKKQGKNRCIVYNVTLLRSKSCPLPRPKEKG
jgi:diguanylate cyclase (GGDEF)-like protein